MKSGRSLVQLLRILLAWVSTCGVANQRSLIRKSGSSDELRIECPHRVAQKRVNAENDGFQLRLVLINLKWRTNPRWPQKSRKETRFLEKIEI